MSTREAKPANLTLSEKAAEQISQLIIDTQMQEGSRLPNEKDLMELLNVSRTTVREAMRSLSSRGIVEIKQGSGTFISSMPGVPKDPFGLGFRYDKEKVLLDLLDLRIIMEPTIASFCARRASEEQAAEIMNIAMSISENIGKGTSHIEADVAFHCRIAEVTGGDILIMLFEEIVKGVRLFSSILGDRIIQDIRKDHERIARAIMEHDTLYAYNAMLTHLERNRYAIEEYLEANKEEECSKE